ncbi:hypothetical protein ACFT8W_03700 [Streptomyces hygroscopicus]|uniref:hypothetical protein n=1 Tax=Streptomyces hygroscopicus TaxID=1912 RepID=UPI003634A7B1
MLGLVAIGVHTGEDVPVQACCFVGYGDLCAQGVQRAGEHVGVDGSGADAVVRGRQAVQPVRVPLGGGLGLVQRVAGVAAG